MESLIINFPSFPEIKGEFETSKKERMALYDIVMGAFMCKYTYEQAKLAHKEQAYANKNLDNIKVYSSFLNEVNSKIKDVTLREYVLDTLKSLKENNYNRASVKKTYETVRKWFAPDTFSGKIFKNNLVSGDERGSINFLEIFRRCNKQAITEDSKLFDDVKQQYKIYLDEYEDLIK